MRSSAIVVDVEQGTPEWLQLRIGVFAASEFDKLITPSARRPSTQRDGLIYRMASEVLMGRPIETRQTSWMAWGLLYEDEARRFYKMETGLDVMHPGFVFKDETRRVGCSPDGLTKTGGLEVKCPSPETHLRYLLDGVLPTEYVCQVQGCLYVTGQDYWDFLSYHPELPPFLLRVEPDKDWHTAFSIVLPQAIQELDAVLQRVRGATE
jgi:hypothetical protein